LVGLRRQFVKPALCVAKRIDENRARFGSHRPSETGLRRPFQRFCRTLPSNATSGLRAAKIRFPNDCGAGEVTAPDKGDLHGKAELVAPRACVSRLGAPAAGNGGAKTAPGATLRRCPKSIASFHETSARCCSSILDGMSLVSC
jgi:hypothetical protein